MRLRNVADQRQAQAASFRVMHQRIAGPVELLEDLRLLAPGDADAVINYLELYRSIFPVQLHAQELFVSRILQRVVNQIDESARDRLRSTYTFGRLESML